MTSINRTVENGGKFSMSIWRPMLRYFKICPICRAERTTIADHIQPWQWGGTNAENNCGPTCGKCHDNKSKEEADIENNSAYTDKQSAKMMEQHIARYFAFHFTPTGKRRVVKSVTRGSNAAKIARKIHRKKTNARKISDKLTRRELVIVKLSQDDFLRELASLESNRQALLRQYRKQHSLAAKIRQEEKGNKFRRNYK